MRKQIELGNTKPFCFHYLAVLPSTPAFFTDLASRIAYVLKEDEICLALKIAKLHRQGLG